MTRRLIAAVAPFALLLALGACSESQRGAKVPAAASAPSPMMERKAMQGLAPDLEQRRQAGTKRYVAVRNHVVIEVDAAAVEATLKRAQQLCSPPDCEILESSIARDFREAPPQARLRLRIAPKSSEGFIDELARGGDLIERRVESEDKTDQVVDVEARLKNMTELRDRLRKLLASPAASVKDLVEIESQLSRVQTDLDAAAGQRLALAGETEKVTIAMEIRPRRAIVESGALAPIKEAVNSIGHTFAQSVAGLISFVVAVLPWLVLAVPAVWLWRRWRRSRRAAAPAQRK
jgi:hypothetical protein